MTVVNVAGSVEGFVARVDTGGRLQVSGLPPVSEIHQSQPTAPNGVSAEIVAARTGRTCLSIQNVGAFPVHVSLGDTSSPAGPGHHMIAVGAEFELCGHIRYEGPVQAFGVGGASIVSVIESTVA